MSLWYVSRAEGTKRRGHVYVEAVHWFDAREVAGRYLGVDREGIEVQRQSNGERQLPCVVVRVGAGGALIISRTVRVSGGEGHA